MQAPAHPAQHLGFLVRQARLQNVCRRQHVLQPADHDLQTPAVACKAPTICLLCQTALLQMQLGKHSHCSPFMRDAICLVWVLHDRDQGSGRFNVRSSIANLSGSLTAVVAGARHKHSGHRVLQHGLRRSVQPGQLEATARGARRPSRRSGRSAAAAAVAERLAAEARLWFARIGASRHALSGSAATATPDAADKEMRAVRCLHPYATLRT